MRCARRFASSVWLVVALIGDASAQMDPKLSANPPVWDGTSAGVLPSSGNHVVSPEYVTGLDGSYLDGCTGRPTKLQFTLDLLVLDRGDADGSPLLIDTQTQQVLLSNDELIAHGEPGVRMGLILLDEDGWDIEFGYMGLDPFGGPRTYSSTSPIIFPFFGGIPINPQTSYSVHYLSRNHSGEVNLRRELTDRVTVLGGFRFLELNETFDISSSAGSFFSATDNDLYGFQLGGDLYLAQIRRSILFSTLKSGVYYNNADVMAEALSGNAIIKFVDDEDEVAFVGDVAVGLLVPMGSHAEFRIGYQGLYLDGVGLAPDQSDNYSLFTSSGSLDSSTLLYHGGFVGIDLFW